MIISADDDDAVGIPLLDEEGLLPPALNDNGDDAVPGLRVLPLPLLPVWLLMGLRDPQLQTPVLKNELRYYVVQSRRAMMIRLSPAPTNNVMRQ